MRISYRMGEELWDHQECDTFNHEVHEATGRVIVRFYQTMGSENKLVRLSTDVTDFRVER